MAGTDKETFVLGSGDLYISEFSDYDVDEMPELPSDETIEVSTNKIGHIQGGASLEYKPTIYQVKDDFDYVLDSFITEEEATFKSGILTWNMAVLQKLTAASEVVNDDTKNTTTIKIGGRGKSGITPKIVRFVHTMRGTGKKLRVTIVGTPSEGFTLTFDPKAEKTLDAVFTAIPHDSEGTLIQIKKELVSASGPQPAET